MTVLSTFLALVASMVVSAGQPQPKTSDPKAPPAAKRVGDVYPLANCPISGAKLTDASVNKLYEGREVRFCCDKCPSKFEKDLKDSFAKIDQKIIKDQAPLYPLKTSLVTGKELPEKPYEFVYGNRLVRLGDEKERGEFDKDAAKHLAALDKAVIEQQGKTYPFKACLVTDESFGGDMGDPADVVLGGRLVRLCCKGCLKKLEKDAPVFIAKVDEARKAKAQPKKEEKKSGG